MGWEGVGGPAGLGIGLSRNGQVLKVGLRQKGEHRSSTQDLGKSYTREEEW